MTSKAKKKGYAIRVDLQTLTDGERAPETWAEVPKPMAAAIASLAESPEVEYVEVIGSGVRLLAAFAPRDVQTLANMIQGRAPALAAILRESTDVRLSDEIRVLLGEPPTVPYG